MTKKQCMSCTFFNVARRSIRCDAKIFGVQNSDLRSSLLKGKKCPAHEEADKK